MSANSKPVEIGSRRYWIVDGLSKVEAVAVIYKRELLENLYIFLLRFALVIDVRPAHASRARLQRIPHQFICMVVFLFE